MSRPFGAGADSVETADGTIRIGMNVRYAEVYWGGPAIGRIAAEGARPPRRAAPRCDRTRCSGRVGSRTRGLKVTPEWPQVDARNGKYLHKPGF
jgi:hypothetical protein